MGVDVSSIRTPNEVGQYPSTTFRETARVRWPGVLRRIKKEDPKAMRPKVLTAICVLASSLPSAQIPPVITGQWVIAGPIIQERVPLRFLTSPNSISESTVPLSQLRGFPLSQIGPGAWPQRPKAVQFDVVREAGTLRMSGYLRNASGGGDFSVTLDPKFAAAWLRPSVGS
jgi:hypothetical protein